MPPIYDGIIWAYRAVITKKTTTGDAGITIMPGLGQRMEVLAIRTGQDDYASARTVDVAWRDEDDNTISKLMGKSADNEILIGPQLQTLEQKTANVSNPVGSPYSELIISGDDYLRFRTAAALVNETLTVTFRAKIFGEKPTVAVLDANQDIAESQDTWI